MNRIRKLITGFGIRKSSSLNGSRNSTPASERRVTFMQRLTHTSTEDDDDEDDDEEDDDDEDEEDENEDDEDAEDIFCSAKRVRFQSRLRRARGVALGSRSYRKRNRESLKRDSPSTTPTAKRKKSPEKNTSSTSYLLMLNKNNRHRWMRTSGKKSSTSSQSQPAISSYLGTCVCVCVCSIGNHCNKMLKLCN